MALEDEPSYDKLAERLMKGFGPLLEQAHELANRNQDLEQRLARVREVVNPPSVAHRQLL